MAVLGRCVVYLSAAFILLMLITGAESQCGTAYNRTLRLLARRLIYDNIVSPGHPNNYPDKARCQWLLYTTPGYVIHMHVAWVDMEETYQCAYDALTVYDGQTVYHKRIGKICTDRTKDFYSSGSFMYLEFRSDFSVSAKGFDIEFSAIRRSQIPVTVTPSDPWMYPRDTTTRTTTTTTTTSTNRYGWPSYSVAALIGGLSGALVLLFVLFALARYYLGRHYRGGGGRRQTARPYPPPSSGHPPPASTIYHNNNAVFMVSSTSNTRLHPSASPSAPAYGGATNLAFSPYGEAPPAYFAVQQSTTVVQPGGTMVGVSYGVPPPSYTEAMRFSHPPAEAPQPPHPPPPPARPLGLSVLPAAAASSGNGPATVPPLPPPPIPPPPPPTGTAPPPNAPPPPPPPPTATAPPPPPPIVPPPPPAAESARH